jgi:hypothetical protein
VTRLAINSAVILLAIFPLALCEDVDSAALLNRARATIVANIEKLTKYTCLQTVHRSRFQTVRAVHASGCGQMVYSSANVQPGLMLAWTDRLKLDVTVSEGAEIFSWAGAHHFQSEDVDKIVGSGMTGTGDFGPFLISIFGGGAAKYDYLGLALQAQGPALAMYRYHVPLATSHYRMKVGPRPKDLVSMAYEGKFWIDPQNAELRRLTIEVPKPPRGSETCRVETTINYQRARIGSSDFLLPQLTVLDMWIPDGERHENRIEYASCRAFQSESVFHADTDTIAGVSLAAQTPITIPLGVTIKIALRSTISSASSFAGDAIEGQLLYPIGTVVPKGAIVRGRIVRFEHEYQPSNYVALGLEFHSIEVNGTEVPLALISVTHGKQLLGGSLDTRQGIGTFVFQNDRVVLDEKFVSEWKTTVKERPE